MSYTVCRYGTQSHIGECESLNKSTGKCEPTGENCDATRYVRAEVAMRLARAEAKKAYQLGRDYGYGPCNDGGIVNKRNRTMREALEALKRGAGEIGYGEIIKRMANVVNQREGK